MKSGKALLDPFVLAALLLLLSSLFTFYNSFVLRNFPTFTTEEEIGESIEREFPQFAEYL